MSRKKQTEEVPLPIVKVEPEVEQSLKNTESVVGGIYTDLDEVGNIAERMEETVGGISLAVKALVKQYVADRKKQEEFNRKIEYLISSEVERQLKPLVDRLDSLVKHKPKFLWVMPSFPKMGLWTKIKMKFIKVKEVKK